MLEFTLLREGVFLDVLRGRFRFFGDLIKLLRSGLVLRRLATNRENDDRQEGDD
jgi:hypothetical protein